MSNPTTPFSWQMPTATDLVTDLPADFEVFGQAVATSMADLLGGTTGQILSKTTNADMDFTWINNDQGDITGITASSPLTGGGTSGAVTVGIQDALTTQKGAVQLSDSTSTTSSILAATPTAVKSAYDLANTANTTANAAIAKAIVDAKGDLIAATAADTVARLAIGTNAQVLTADSTAATGMKWATPASGGMTLINSGGTTLSGASTTISSIPSGYTYLYGEIVGFRPATNAADLRAQFSGDTGSNYSWIGGSVFNQPSTKFTDVGCSSSSDNSNIQFQMPNYLSSCWKFAEVNSLNPKSTNANDFSAQNYISAWNGTGAVTSITFLPSTGNFTSGTVYLYGVK